MNICHYINMILLILVMIGHILSCLANMGKSICTKPEYKMSVCGQLLDVLCIDMCYHCYSFAVSIQLTNDSFVPR